MEIGVDRCCYMRTNYHSSKTISENYCQLKIVFEIGVKLPSNDIVQPISHREKSKKKINKIKYEDENDGKENFSILISISMIFSTFTIALNLTIIGKPLS